MARMHQWLVLALGGLLLTGCVTQEKYNAMKLDRDRALEQASAADAANRQLQGKVDAYESQFGKLQGGFSDSNALIKNLTEQNAALQSKYDDAMRQLEAALANGGGGPLPVALSNTLEKFAAQYPELVEFDRARGIVKFKSDVTFQSGDATLKPEARAAIDKFATILNSPEAASYELMVAGHTDNVRVSTAATIAAGHKDNWYLSSHRAISVGEELIGQRVKATRIGVVGYGEQRPAASNTSAAGRQQNRRVEVLILPTTISGPAVAPSDATSVAPKVAPPLNKNEMTPSETVTPTAPDMTPVGPNK